MTRKTATAAKAADNVIPTFASMTLNYRPLPGDDAGSVPMEHLRRAAAAAGLAFDDDDGSSEGKPRKKRRKNTPLVSASVSALRIEQASAVTRADSKPMNALRRAIASSMAGESGMAVVVREFFSFFFIFVFFFSFDLDADGKKRRKRATLALSISQALFPPFSLF